MKASAVAILVVIAAIPASAQSRDTLHVDIGRGSQVWIEGSSNIAGWRCEANAFEARVEVEPGEAASALKAINIKVAVRDLKCGNRKMDHDLYAALKAGDPAQASFIIGRFDVVADSGQRAGIGTRGELVVAGVERAVSVPVTTDRIDGVVRARGAVSMLMTDFGIKPPTGLFGLIRSRNEITVKFDLAVPPRTFGLR